MHGTLCHANHSSPFSQGTLSATGRHIYVSSAGIPSPTHYIFSRVYFCSHLVGDCGKAKKTPLESLPLTFYGGRDGESSMLEQCFNALRIGGTLTQRATSSTPLRCQPCLNMAASYILLYTNADGGLLGVYTLWRSTINLQPQTSSVQRPGASGAWQLLMQGNPSAHSLETAYRALCNHREFSRPQLKTRGHTSTSVPAQPICPQRLPALRR